MIQLSPEQLALAKPVANIVQAILKPLALKAWQWTEETAERAKFEICFGDLNRSIENSYNRYSYFTSLVFKNEQKRLDDHYLPLTLLKHPDNEPTQINHFPHELISKHRRLLIVDTAGMGKSTISKFLYLTAIRENAAIPILIELRKLSGKKDIVDFIAESTKGINGEIPRKLIVSLISEGRFIFLFDGYDEIPELERPTVTSNISEFIAAAPDNWFVMTSREEGGLSSFPSFQRFTIKPLEKLEAYKLLRLYDQSGEYAEALIGKLEDVVNANVHEFLTNPLLASLLFKSFEFKRAIPIRKHIFYRQVFEALFENHDLMKDDYQRGKRSGLDIDQFDELLRYLSFLTYKDGKFSYTKDELLHYVEKTKQLTTHKAIQANHVVYDLTHGVPLMIEEGNDIRWVHRSMQEYFAAQWICRDSKEKQKDHLIRMYKDIKHQNLMILCADIDPIAFSRSVVKELAIRLLREFETTYQNIPDTIPKELVERRKRVVTGQITFVSTKHFSTDSRGETAWLEHNEGMMKALENYCTSIGQKHHGATWGGGAIQAGVIRVDNSMIENPLFQQMLPFIKPIDPILIDEPLDLPSEYLIPINDHPDNPVNSQSNFDKITSYLTARKQWCFDPIVAREVLMQIEFEESEANSLEL